MAIYNGSALDIVNAVSLKVNGIPADNLARPTKAEILAEVNEVTRTTLSRKNWDFLFKTDNIANYTLLGKNQALYRPYAGSQLVSHSAGTVGQEDYYAYDITANAAALGGDLWCLDAAVVSLLAGGIGSVYGTVTLMLCKGTGAGVPDTANPVATKSFAIVDNLITDYYGATLDISSATDVTFSFTQDTLDSVIVKPGQAFLVMKVAYTTGSTTYLDALCGTGGDYSYSRINSATWTLKQNTNFQVRIDIQPATFIVNKEGILTLPADVEVLKMLYVGTFSAPTETIAEYMSTKAMMDKAGQPWGSYFKYDIDIAGNKRIYIKGATDNVTSFNIIYKKQPTLLVNDADLSDIPANFRDMLVYKAAYNFLSRGYGEQDAGNLQALLTDFNAQYLAMREECLPKKSSCFALAQQGGTPNTEMNTYEPNSWSQGITPSGYDKRYL